MRLTARAEHHTVVLVFHDNSLFSLSLFKFVRAKRAVFYALSATDAFFVVDSGIPWDLFSRNSLVRFSVQSFWHPPFVDDVFSVKNCVYLRYLNIHFPVSDNIYKAGLRIFLMNNIMTRMAITDVTAL